MNNIPENKMLVFADHMSSLSLSEKIQDAVQAVFPMIQVEQMENLTEKVILLAPSWASIEDLEAVKKAVQKVFEDRQLLVTIYVGRQVDV